MLINIIDLEATCWDGPTPTDEIQEITEVGLAVYDTQTRTVRRSPPLLVMNQHSTISQYCTNLTTLTQEMLEGQPTWPEMATYLQRTYKTSERIWASFGNWDREMFARQAIFCNIRCPMAKQHLNVKALAALYFGRKVKGMPEALSLLGLELIGLHHRGNDDAYNIGRILDLLLHQEVTV